MFIGLDSSNDGGDSAFGIDHKRSPLNAHVLSSVHAFFFEYVELFGGFFVHVGEQGVRQFVFIFEFFLGRRLIRRNAQHYGAGFLYLLECVAEPARFYCSTGSIGLGIEKQDQVLSAIIFQGDGLAFFIGKRDLRGFGFIISMRLHDFNSRFSTIAFI